MKKLAIVFIVLAFCTSPKTDPRIKKFEDYLGPEKVEVINTAVHLFDSVVTGLYKSPHINTSYQRFMADLKNDRIKLRTLFNENELRKLHEHCKSSGLWNELHLEFRRVYVKDGDLFTEFAYIPLGSDTPVYTMESQQITPKLKCDSLTIDSLVKEEKQTLWFNPSGKYMKAVDLIKDNDSTIIKYLDIKETSGSVLPNLLAGGFIYSKADFNDYFIRRIFAVELLL